MIAAIGTILILAMFVAAMIWGNALLRLDWRVRLAIAFGIIAIFGGLAAWEYL